MSYRPYIGVWAAGKNLFGSGRFANKRVLSRYGGHSYAGQCIWQKNLAPGAKVLAPLSNWAFVNSLAAGPGRGNTSDYGFG